MALDSFEVIELVDKVLGESKREENRTDNHLLIYVGKR